MSEEKLLTIRDVAIVLGVSEKEVMNLAETGIISAYKVGGVYIRFKREQVEQYRKVQKVASQKIKSAPDYSFKDRVTDFFYFNDFYILSVLLIVLILIIIFRG